MASFNATQIFAEGSTEEKGENARLSAFVGAIAVGEYSFYSDFGILC
jgi:T-complex protein 1 subunit beta